MLQCLLRLSGHFPQIGKNWGFGDFPNLWKAELTAFLSCEATTSVVSALTTRPSRSAIQIIPFADGVISEVAMASKVTSREPELLLICCEVTIWPCE